MGELPGPGISQSSDVPQISHFYVASLPGRFGLQTSQVELAYRSMSTLPPSPPPGYPVPPPGQQSIAPTPPSKKANLAFYIGGGCLVLLLLVLVTCSVGIRSCAHLISSNPTFLARMIAGINPNLDVLDVNETKGTIKVRDKSSNKTFYLNLNDAKRGKIEIVDEDGKGIRITHDGTAGRVEVTGENGENAVITTGDTAPHGGWVPAYPGAKTLASVNADKNGTQSGVYTFETGDSAQQVLDFYKSKLKVNGFSVLNETSIADQMQSIQLGKGDRVVNIEVTHQGAKSTAAVTYGAK